MIANDTPTRAKGVEELVCRPPLRGPWGAGWTETDYGKGPRR